MCIAREPQRCSCACCNGGCCFLPHHGINEKKITNILEDMRQLPSIVDIIENELGIYDETI